MTKQDNSSDTKSLNANSDKDKNEMLKKQKISKALRDNLKRRKKPNK